MKINNSASARSAGIHVLQCHQLDQRIGWACDIWVISNCPYCGERHLHGAGEGLRSPHCAAGTPEDYYLVRELSTKQ